MNEIRIGIIGTGVISHRHIKVLSQIPQARVVAICDIDRKKLDEWGDQYNITERYTDYRELLKRDDIDAVDVCVHNNLHLPLSVAVMRAGKHCYCEKPMAGSYADAKTLYDASRIYNRKLAIQISSLFTLQSRMARDMVRNGKLGELYYARSIGHRRRDRTGVDINRYAPEFYSDTYAGHGALYDMGVYHISQLLFIMGVPKLTSVYGSVYQKIGIDQRLLEGRIFGVEELGLGLARYENGLTLDIAESWALNMDSLGDTFISGSEGGLKITNVDCTGGALAAPEKVGKNPAELKYFGIQDGFQYTADLDVFENSRYELRRNPDIMLYNDNHLHWLAYLNGDLNDETRYNTPWIALQTTLVSEGIFLSSQLGRSLTADEIESLSVSNAIHRQETVWGTFEYDF